MTRRLILSRLLIFAVFAARGFAFEKVGTTSFQFLKIMTDARSTGMGEAYVSVVNTSEAVFWNPAALVRVSRLDASVSRLNWLLNISHTSFSAAYSIFGLGTFGIHGLFTDVGEIPVTRVEALGFRGSTYNPGLTGETISPSSMSMGLSFARQLTDKFAFGLTGKFVQEDLVVKKASRFVFDGGLMFDTGFRSLSVAAVVRHFGSQIKFYDKNYPLPQTFTIGVSGFIIGPNALLLRTDQHTFLVSYDLSHPRDYNQQHHIGAEYSFHDFVFIRSGYKINYDEEGMTFGFGLKKSRLRIDYSYNTFGEYFDAVHRFTIGFLLK